jgi:hypothetical protein
MDILWKNLSIKIGGQFPAAVPEAYSFSESSRKPLASHGQMRDDQNEKVTTGEKRI